MKIAIIGGGISGLSLAYFMKEVADVTIYEKNDYIGGHSRTIEVNTDEGAIPVDTISLYISRHYFMESVPSKRKVM